MSTQKVHMPPEVRLGRTVLNLVSYLILLFLIMPVVVVVLVSFSSGQYQFPPPGFSLRWYRQLVGNPAWSEAAWLSLRVGVAAMVLATIIGTMAALGLRRWNSRWKEPIQSVLMAPMVVPVIIIAIAVYSLLAPVGLLGTWLGLVLAHTLLGLPFVVINVTAAMYGVDERLEQAAANCGASPFTTFWRVTLPLALPGVLSGAIFAFISSWDEVVVAIFVSGLNATTLPKLMWDNVRAEIDPTIAAVSAILFFITIVALSVRQLALRRSRF